MKRLLTLVAFFATLQASAQQVNPVPDYVFRNQMSVGRNAVTDTAAYFSIGPRYGATKGFMPPIVGDTATFSSGKRNGLLIFSVQKNKFLYWDSVRVQWSDMAGSSGSYITGSGITGYLPQFSASTILDTSALFTLGNRLGIGTSTFAYNSTNTANMELNGTAGGILGFKRNDSARGYLWHTGDNMELANTAAGSISFNTNSATRGSISSAGVWRLHNLAGTGDRVVQASSNGTLSATTSVTGLVDTTTISTRAWRQKGDDSLGAIIATKGSGTVTSVATGYGLSGGTITTTGTLLVDTLNIATRAWRQKGIDSVVSIIPAAGVGGSGTTNYIPKFTAGSTIGNSQIFDNGTNVGIGVTPGTTNLGKSLSLNYFGNGLFSYATDNVYLNSNTYYNGDWKYANSAAASQYVQFGGAHLWYTAPSGTANNNVTLTERLRITSGGDVGISQPSLLWTATNRRLLELNGTSQSLIGLNVNSLKAGYIWQNGNDMTIATENAGYIQFGTNGSSDRMRIFSNGRVGINTTTDAGYQLDVNGTLRTVNGANFATTSGSIGIGTASPSASSKVTISSATGYGIELDNTATGGLKWQIGSSADDFGAGGGKFLITYGNNSLVSPFTIVQSTSNIGISTTSPSYKLDINGTLRSVNGANFATTSGNVGIGTTSPLSKLHALGAGGSTAVKLTLSNGGDVTALNDPMGVIDFYSDDASGGLQGTKGYLGVYNEFNGNWDGSGSRYDTYMAFGTSLDNSLSEKMRIKSDAELLINTTSDAGDYKLQVSGNARIGTGKLDIASNTTFGLGIARSGTSEVAGQIYNSNGILYLGAESSAGGQIFSGSSAYAAVIGSGANYPLQFATNNATRATITSSGKFIVGATSEYFFSSKMEVNGGMAIRNTPTDGSLLLDSTALYLYGITNRVGFNMTNGKLTGSNASPAFTIYDWTWNTTANVNLVDISLVNTASGASSNYFRISDGTNEFKVTKAAEVVTAAPTGGSIRKWKLGEAATVSPTSPNRTIRVEIDGTVYYLHAKTTND